MASYVEIYFDTSKPTIDVYAPSYTDTELLNEIVVEANEPLSEEHTAYVIDSLGYRHDYTFEKEEENKLVGIIRFATYPLGIATIYVESYDEVLNKSNIVEKSIEIREALTLLKLDIREIDRDINTNDIEREINTDEREANMIIKESKM